MKVGIIGVGKVGSCMMACFAKHGHNVLGYDVRQNPLDNISRTEKDLSRLIERFKLRDRIRSLEEVVYHSEMLFIIVQTPSLPNGCFDISYVERALRDIGRIDKSKPCIINSTLPPGACRKLSSLVDSLYYNPLYIRLGNVIEDLERIRFVMIGSSDGQPFKRLEDFWRSTSAADHILWDTYETVEVTKLALNCIMTCQISMINKLDEIFEKSSGNIEYLLEILKLDDRFKFGNYRPGLGYGGPCLPRDNRMMGYHCARIGVNGFIFDEIDNINSEQLYRIAEKYRAYDRIGVYGLGYKPYSDITTDSQPLELVRVLRDMGKTVETYDPYLPELSTVKSEEELEEKTDIVLLCFPYNTKIKCERIWRTGHDRDI